MRKEAKGMQQSGTVGKGRNMESGEPGFQPHIQLSALWPWGHELVYLSLSFLICAMGLITSPLQDAMRIAWTHTEFLLRGGPCVCVCAWRWDIQMKVNNIKEGRKGITWAGIELLELSLNISRADLLAITCHRRSRAERRLASYKIELLRLTAIIKCLYTLTTVSHTFSPMLFKGLSPHSSPLCLLFHKNKQILRSHPQSFWIRRFEVKTRNLHFKRISQLLIHRVHRPHFGKY